MAYDSVAFKLRGDAARLNFPELPRDGAYFRLLATFLRRRQAASHLKRHDRFTKTRKV
ncbi:hypothetical protein Cni_G00174 [Canna indica]|uniref:AP2/ERF domain-containing protein n=1 Tax=Canna indica TaxID=4628 RepID=A0AAQ3JLX7_9LILI|nr:hypothetical protein Cni_G00174 [Canna indica]